MAKPNCEGICKQKEQTTEARWRCASCGKLYCDNCAIAGGIASEGLTLAAAPASGKFQTHATCLPCGTVLSWLGEAPSTEAASDPALVWLDLFPVVHLTFVELVEEEIFEKAKAALVEALGVDDEDVLIELIREKIFEGIRDAMVEALGVDEDEATPEATLVGDLGAESIDFLDIVFRLEKAFHIKIPRGELFPEDVLTNPEYVQDGRVTEAGLAELRSRMPFANLDEFAKNPIVQDFGSLLTVADMCRFIEGKLEVTG